MRRMSGGRWRGRRWWGRGGGVAMLLGCRVRGYASRRWSRTIGTSFGCVCAGSGGERIVRGRRACGCCRRGNWGREYLLLMRRSGKVIWVWCRWCCPVKDVARCSWLGLFDFYSDRMVSLRPCYLEIFWPVAVVVAFEGHS